MQFGPQRHAMVRIWFTFLDPLFFFFSDTWSFITGTCLLITVRLLTDNLLFSDHSDQTIKNQTVTQKSSFTKINSNVLLWSVFVSTVHCKVILFDAFSPIVRTKTNKNTDENGSFKKRFQKKGLLKTHRFDNAPLLAWMGENWQSLLRTLRFYRIILDILGENKLTEAFESDAEKSVKSCRFDQRFWLFNGSLGVDRWKQNKKPTDARSPRSRQT